MKSTNHATTREKILLEFLSAYEQDGMQRIFFCTGLRQKLENTDEE